MSSGVPCVVTDVGDSSLIVGEYGVVVSPGNDVSMKEGMKRLLKRINKKNLHQLTRQRIEKNYSIQQLVNKTTSAFNSLIN